MKKKMSCNCEDHKGYNESRRNFMSNLIFFISALILAFLAFPLIASLLAPVIERNKSVWRRIGNVSDFKEGETKKVTFKNPNFYKWSTKISHSAAWVRKDKDGQIIAFSVNCSHLGCPVRWEESPKMFFCPCHGGAFYKDGSRAAGPPNRGLYNYPVRLQNGDIELEIEAIPITDISA